VRHGAGRLPSVRWGDANFVFHAESGQTHLLNQTCMDLLDLLGQAPRTLEDLYRLLRARYGVDDEDPDLREALDSVVRVLDTLGLIVPLP